MRKRWERAIKMRESIELHKQLSVCNQIVIQFMQLKKCNRTNISQEKSMNWCRKGQRSWKTQHINLCTSKTGYSKIHCSYLPYARVLPFVLRNTHAHQEIVRICEPYCYYRMQRSEGIHGWSLRESVGDRAVSHPGNSIVDGKIGTTVVQLGRCLHYYDLAPPILRIRSVSEGNGETGWNNANYCTKIRSHEIGALNKRFNRA